MHACLLLALRIIPPSSAGAELPDVVYTRHETSTTLLQEEALLEQRGFVLVSLNAHADISERSESPDLYLSCSFKTSLDCEHA